ncbi:hypothetical protein K0M31_000709 [Melipona bicolor]|uniref:Uncharacterized protein n=1 Tax=Melipona bicolor TaxID=60889 RepID=A0AA40KXB0_9HYME|nr:hypothetical protein K0M31_000709 [Melipona bicolor]
MSVACPDSQDAETGIRDLDPRLSSRHPDCESLLTHPSAAIRYLRRMETLSSRLSGRLTRLVKQDAQQAWLREPDSPMLRE